MKKIETYASVWDAIADTPEQAANLRARAELMQQIAVIVKESCWTQAEAATRCGVTQPRMNDLLRGRVSRFSLDALVNIATAIGRRVHLEKWRSHDYSTHPVLAFTKIDQKSCIS